MALFFSTLPLWLSALLLVILPALLAMAGPVLIRRRVGLDRLTTNNEIAGFKFATVGVIYAVLVAFAVIVVWERFSDGESAVLQEAGSAATLYRLTSGPNPNVNAARNALDKYLKLTVEKDWPAMASANESDEVTRALSDLYASITGLSEKAAAAPPILSEMFRQLDSITQARRTRLHLASGIVPDVLWVVLFTGAFLTIGFTFFFGTENLAAQVMMTGILAVIVLMSLLVIVTIDHPFSGPVHIESEPLQRVLEDFQAQSK